MPTIPIPNFQTAFRQKALEGTGLQLRRLTMEDAPQLTTYANNPKIAANLMDRFPSPYTLESAHWFINYAAENEGESVFAIDRGEGLIGVISLIFKPDIYAASAELGYWLGEPFWGQGIMTGALSLIVRHAFEDLQHSRVYANVFHTNPASRRVLEKAGFEREGIARKAIVKKGRILDVWTYGKVNPNL
jgi:RimJ/RimL family protein N-acetyltransferase